MPPTPTARSWIPVAYTMFCIGWGANVFAPLLLLYTRRQHLPDTTGSAIFGSYALSLIPALLIGGMLSDRHGRRPVMRGAAFASVIASLLLIGGADNEPLLFAGRAFAGIASGLAFGSGTAWVKELSSSAVGNPGARRAAIAMSAGFGSGGLFGGLIAQWAPAPQLVPYLVHIAMMVVAIAIVWRAPESRYHSTRTHAIDDALTLANIRIFSHPQFLALIVPTAPWVFGTATISFTVLPRLVTTHTEGFALAFAGLVTGITQLTGVAIQPWAQRREASGKRDLLLIGMFAAALGFAVGVTIARTGSPWLVLVAALVLGVAYGILLVSGLQEITRMADPHVLGRFVSTFYVLAYGGFAIPYILAAITPWVSYPFSLTACTVIALFICLHLHRQPPGDSRRSVE